MLYTIHFSFGVIEHFPYMISNKINLILIGFQFCLFPWMTKKARWRTLRILQSAKIINTSAIRFHCTLIKISRLKVEKKMSGDFIKLKPMTQGCVIYLIQRVHVCRLFCSVIHLSFIRSSYFVGVGAWGKIRLHWTSCTPPELIWWLMGL